MKKFTLLVLFIWILSGALGYVLAAPQDADEDKVCDNSGAKDTSARFHNCDCNKSKAQCDSDNPTPPEPMKGCKTYCKPEHCECSTESCSHT